MNIELIEELLHEDESTTLDFKQEQYPFEKASKEQKGELLKDILAFANAWRRTEAFILIGIEEVKGGRSKIIGILQHLDEASIQQFINSKVNRPINFSYRAMVYEGKQIGLIQIPLQERPIFLKENFGRLSKDTVYIRRGSSTDCANPDEIARMGAATASLNQIPSVDLQFAEEKSHTEMGRELNIQSEMIFLPNKSLIPLVQSDHLASIIGSANPNYYREFAEYLRYTSLLRPVGFVLKNTGKTVITNVRLQIVQQKTDGLLFLDIADYPSQPQYSGPFFKSIPGGFKSILHNDTETSVNDRIDVWEISAKVGSIQPKAEGWTGIFYLGSIQPYSIDLKATVYADNLPEPDMQIKWCKWEFGQNEIEIT